MRKIGLAIVVRGRVQGVGFRYCACDAAVRLGVYGFVKNMHDGTVYAELFGDENNVRECMIYITEKGRCGMVSDFTTHEIPFTSDYVDFTIKRDYEP